MALRRQVVEPEVVRSSRRRLLGCPTLRCNPVCVGARVRGMPWLRSHRSRCLAKGTRSSRSRHTKGSTRTAHWRVSKPCLQRPKM